MSDHSKPFSEPDSLAMESGLYVEVKRFFVTLPQPPDTLPTDIAVTDAATVHHLRTVCRAKPGERVVVVDGARRVAYQAEIADIRKQAVDLHLLASHSSSAQPGRGVPRVILAAALLKEQRWDLLLQKATELGVSEIQPLSAERSVVRLSEKDFQRKLERWETVLRAAAEQSEGLFIPVIRSPLSPVAFVEAASAPASDARKIVLLERGEGRKPLKQALSGIHADETVLLTIGPEGGWGQKEKDLFQQAGFAGASLGSRVLRSETAAMAALAAVLYECAE
jgi:16S rRNA (uracil1498-N3)-methyltransferase